MKKIIYTCSYVPVEWIVAHGFEPYRWVPKTVSDNECSIPVEGVCSFVRLLLVDLLQVQEAKGIILTTVCDQMRRGFEVLSNITDSSTFLMHVPNTWQSVNAHRFYQQELRRLGRFLVRLGGQSPSEKRLTRIMTQSDQERLQIKDPGTTLNHGIPVALVGGPLLRKDHMIFNLLQRHGIRVVLDGTETGRRTQRRAFNRRRMQEDPLAELADAYFGAMPDIRRRPNNQFYQWLKEQMDILDIRGVIYYRHLWCDMWQAERDRLRDWLDIPLLDMETSEHESFHEYRTLTRIQAFVETLT